MGNERWAPAPGFERRYEVSSEGRIRSLDRPMYYSDGRIGHLRGKMMSPVLGKRGYMSVVFDSTKRRTVHQLVARAFLGKPPPGKQVVHHKNGNKTDNRLENLEWSTYRRNNHLARRDGLNRQRGVNCNLTKYSELTVRAVHSLRAEGYGYKEIATVTGMSEYHVGEIVRSESRTHG